MPVSIDVPAFTESEPSNWEIQVELPVGVWVQVPAVPVAERRTWVEAEREKLRASWGDGWSDAVAMFADAALEHGLGSRDEDDEFTLQLWLPPLPYAAIVHVTMTSADVGFDWDAVAGDLLAIELAGIGPAVQRYYTQTLGEDEIVGVGLDFVAVGGGGGVAVRLEPVMPEMVSLIAPLVWTLANSVVVSGPDGHLKSLPPVGKRLGATWQVLESDVADARSAG